MPAAVSRAKTGDDLEWRVFSVEVCGLSPVKVATPGCCGISFVERQMASGLSTSWPSASFGIFQVSLRLGAKYNGSNYTFKSTDPTSGATSRSATYHTITYTTHSL